MDTPSFMVAPEPIAEADISKTIETEVVVVGGGLSGFAAAATAATEGAKVVLCEKRETWTYHGLANAAVGSKLQKEAGIEIDERALMWEMNKQSVGRADLSVVNVWRKKSGEAMDWLLSLTEKDPNNTVLLIGTPEEYNPAVEPFTEFPTAHVFSDGVHKAEGSEAGYPFSNYVVVNAMRIEAEEQGVEIHYETPAVQLIANDGAVTGVICKTAAGEYVRFNASKGVVLAAGDYGNNPEMMAKYQAEEMLTAQCEYEPPVNTGDGHKMGLWAGADIDPGPHGMVGFPSGAQLRWHSFIKVNNRGERFTNEDVSMWYAAASIGVQPGRSCWHLADADYPEYILRGGPHATRTVIDVEFMKGLVAQGLEEGLYVQADTLDELAELMDVPADTLKKTVERYNGFVENGSDDDFGTPVDRMFPVAKPPFLAGKVGVLFYVTLGGLRVNPEMKVLDHDANPIPGLFASGNVAGSHFGFVNYDVTPGDTHGHALVTGRAAGFSVAGKEY